MLFRFRMREDHIRVALQSLEVVRGKSFASFRRDQQETGLTHQSFNTRGR